MVDPKMGGKEERIEISIKEFAKDEKQLIHILKILSRHQLLVKQSHFDVSNIKEQQRQQLHHYGIEYQALKKFIFEYRSKRSFSSCEQEDIFKQIFQFIVKDHLCCRKYINTAPTQNILQVLNTLRLFLRDSQYLKMFFDSDGLKSFSQILSHYVDQFVASGGTQTTDLVLCELTNICQKLSSCSGQSEELFAHNIHKCLVLLLASNHVMILHSCFFSLIGLAQCGERRSLIGQLNCTEMLIVIAQDYDITSKQLSVTLLRLLASDSHIREQIRANSGVPVLLSLLDAENIKLLWNVIWILVLLVEDRETSDEVRLLGGIPLILNFLSEKAFVKEGPVKQVDLATKNGNSFVAQVLNVKSAVSAAVTELVLNDTNAHHVVQCNGVFLLGMLLFQQASESTEEIQAMENMQKNALRTLRFLFSMERNRQVFKRLFPPALFEEFIDIGHYKKDLDAYGKLASIIHCLPEEERDEIRQRIESTNQNRAPTHFISQYAVYEHLGTGAFGSVYKVKKTGMQTFLAMKEIQLFNPAFGKSKKDKDQSAGEIINECAFVQEQLRHANVVRYYKAFEEAGKLYIIMDLIDGAPLGEHFKSLSEKKELFSEDRVWNIFTQMILALRYIHKEKHIVHRDLTPNNIMLGEHDKVTITDFGLARQRQSETSIMTSVVGTILYSCPEVVQSLPYGEKADIWALGCVLYQMLTLVPPFYSSNMLSLATKIVEADYDPIPVENYSAQLRQAIDRCLTADPDVRPDILEVAAGLSDVILCHVDQLKQRQLNLEKKLEKERNRTQKHFLEANRNMRNYQRLFLASQEQQDRLSSVSSTNDEDSDSEKSYSQSRIRSSSTNDSPFSLPLSDSQSNEASTKRSRSKAKRSLPFAAVPLQRSQEDIGTDENRENVKRTQSSSTYEMRRRKSSSSNKLRPTSATATLTISPRKVRQINDPIMQILTILHKIVYISQLPPSLEFNPQRRIIDQFKRALFSQQTNSVSLKNEMKKLMEGSRDLVDIGLPSGTNEKTRSRTLPSLDSAQDDDTSSEVGISYERLQTMIENVLIDCGYYRLLQTGKPSASQPLGPISHGDDMSSS